MNICCKVCSAKVVLTGEPGCFNLNCECHQEKPTHEIGWEKDFYELTKTLDGQDRPRLKVFISSLLRLEKLTALTHQRESIVSRLEGMKKDVKALYPDVELKPTAEAAMAIEGKNRYNQALEDAIEAVRGCNS